jgi:hypothetical protein
VKIYLLFLIEPSAKPKERDPARNCEGSVGREGLLLATVPPPRNPARQSVARGKGRVASAGMTDLSREENCNPKPTGNGGV